MKKISILLILISLSIGLMAQNKANHMVAVKLFFNDKLVDSVKAKEFQIVSAKGEKTEANGDPIDYRFDAKSQNFVYSSYEDVNTGFMIVHIIDTMEFKVPNYLIYFDKVPFTKGKFVIPGEDAVDVPYSIVANYKSQEHSTKKFDFCEGCKFRNFSVYSWNTVKVSKDQPKPVTPKKK